MKRAVSVALLCALCTGPALAQTSRPGSAKAKTTVSVMDLNATSGISADEQKLLTDKLLNSLVDFQAFEVVERSKRDEILREQGFQLTGACSDASCLVEVGQLLGAQKMIGGTIGRIGNVFAVELRMIDIQTGRVDLTFSKNYTGDVSNLLNAMKQAAEAFSRWRPGEGVAGQMGGLVIISRPEGAKVTLDGREYGATPTYAYPLEPGMHQIVVFKDGYNLYTEGVAVKPGAVDTLEVSLVRPVGTVTITTEPAGAKIYLDGQYQGKAGNQGLRIDNLKSRGYQMEVKRYGYRTKKKLLNVDVGERRITETLSPRRWLLDLSFGFIEQGITGAVEYKPVPWVNGTGGGIDNLFEASLGYRFGKYLALKAGYHYHTGWATNEGWDAVNTYNREYSADFKMPAVVFAAAFYLPLGRFEPYLEGRWGGLLKATADEEIEYIGPNSSFVNHTYRGLKYSNYQLCGGGQIWFSPGAAFAFSFRYNHESVKYLPSGYGLEPSGDFVSYSLANHLGLMFAF